MAAAEGPFEVEFRCRFDNPEAAARVVPFLPSILGNPVPWHGTLYGLELFKSGQILRTGRTIEDGEFHDYLTWKGPDIGGFCNIRREIGEEITAGLSDGVVDMDDAAEELTPVMTRLGPADLATVDTLITAGIAGSRAEVLRWALGRIRENPAYAQLQNRVREISELKTRF